MPYMMMPRPSAVGRSAAVFELGRVTPCGPEIGRLGEHPIFETIEDEHGRRYRYSGVLSSSVAGFDPGQLRKGEFVVGKRLIYRALAAP